MSVCALREERALELPRGPTPVGKLGFPHVSSHAANPLCALQLRAADSIPAPAAHQRHVAAGADGSEQRCHDVSLSLCHLQLPAGKLAFCQGQTSLSALLCPQNG